MKNSPLYLGVDLASVDGNKLIDYTAAKAAGVLFAIFRATYITWADPVWKREAQRARDAGLIVGAYLFPVMGVNSPSAEKQVDAFFAAVGQLAVTDLPPILDVEFAGGIAKTGRNRAQLLEWVKSAVARIKKLFKRPAMIYTSARVFDGEDADSLNADETKGVDLSSLVECPLWLARYPFKTRIEAIGDDADEKSKVENLPLPPVPKLWGPENVWIHQYQGDALRMRGFTATVDLNRFFDLRKGSKGTRVEWLQTKLHCVVDGDFGPATLNAVVAFQRVNGLVPDGIVGPKTFAVLCCSGYVKVEE